MLPIFGSIEDWDVSSVRDMSGMFQGAISFNVDVSKWDASGVTSMKNMFRDARSFDKNLCGNFWVRSNAIKTDMFEGSSGSISKAVCATSTKTQVPTASVGEGLQISSNEHLKSEVADYLKRSPDGRCSDCLQGAIGDWDVSRVTDMSKLFSGAQLFNGDISKWDVSRVTNMHGMFKGAEAFDCDLSKWNVARVEDMGDLFSDAKSFIGDILNGNAFNKDDGSTTSKSERQTRKPIRKNAPSMRAVTRDNKGKFVFHKEAPFMVRPYMPRKSTDDVMISVRAAAINPADYEVCFALFYELYYLRLH